MQKPTLSRSHQWNRSSPVKYDHATNGINGIDHFDSDTQAFCLYFFVYFFLWSASVHPNRRDFISCALNHWPIQPHAHTIFSVAVHFEFYLRITMPYAMENLWSSPAHKVRVRMHMQSKKNKTAEKCRKTCARLWLIWKCRMINGHPTKKKNYEKNKIMIINAIHRRASKC